MKLSYNWLKELVNLKITPEKLAETLNLHVAEVGETLKAGEGLDKVVVAEILEIKPHPNADRLRIVLVDNGKEKLEIVCGAPNIKAGQKVPLALPGAKLPNGMEIKESAIRGVKSVGMLCAEDELGIGTDHEGIFILPAETKLGVSIKEVLGLDDVIFEISNTSITHRPDLFNHLGFAREISACLWQNDLEVKNKNLKIENKKLKTPKKLQIKIENYDLCPRYMAVVMDKIKIKPSPVWLQNRLRNLGLRPINNVVDITNYVLMESGQPLHAFDYNKLTDNKILVRRAKKGENLLALDGKQYVLDENDLVIADSKNPIALAGVMGGEFSGITDKTTTIIIESANFNPVNIRKTSWRLGLRTDAALRFEKGLPFSFAEIGIKRAIDLIGELANGQVVSEVYDFKDKETTKNQLTKVIFDFDKARKLIGLDLSDQMMRKILEKLGCQIKISKGNVLVFAPNWRTDLNLFEDLVEEIVRIYGLEKIMPTPILTELKPVKLESELILERKLRNLLIGLGFDEVYNYSFGPKEGNALEVLNPMNPEQKYLRTSLLPGLLKNAQKNLSYFDEFKIFEIGRTFGWTNDTGTTVEGVEQPKKLTGLIYKKDKNNQDILRTVFGITNLILTEMGLKGFDGQIEIINKLTRVVLEENMGGFEINLESISKLDREIKRFNSIASYPPIKRDLAFLIDKEIAPDVIKQMIKNIDPLIQEVDLFDLFEDKKFGEKRNLAFHIIYQSAEKTLKAEEVEKIERQIIKKLEEKFKAQLRNF